MKLLMFDWEGEFTMIKVDNRESTYKLDINQFAYNIRRAMFDVEIRCEIEPLLLTKTTRKLYGPLFKRRIIVEHNDWIVQLKMLIVT